MNDTLKAFARQTLKDGLAKCTEGQQLVFKLMYCDPTNPWRRTPEDTTRIKATNVGNVVDNIPDEKLDWAMEQVETTLAKAAILSQDAEASR